MDLPSSANGSTVAALGWPPNHTANVLRTGQQHLQGPRCLTVLPAALNPPSLILETDLEVRLPVRHHVQWTSAEKVSLLTCWDYHTRNLPSLLVYLTSGYQLHWDK